MVCFFDRLLPLLLLVLQDSRFWCDLHLAIHHQAQRAGEDYPQQHHLPPSLQPTSVPFTGLPCASAASALHPHSRCSLHTSNCCTLPPREGQRRKKSNWKCVQWWERTSAATNGGRGWRHWKKTKLLNMTPNCKDIVSVWRFNFCNKTARWHVDLCHICIKMTCSEFCDVTKGNVTFKTTSHQLYLTTKPTKVCFCSTL